MSWRTSSERAVGQCLGWLIVIAVAWWVLAHVAGWVS